MEGERDEEGGRWIEEEGRGGGSWWGGCATSIFVGCQTSSGADTAGAKQKSEKRVRATDALMACVRGADTLQVGVAAAIPKLQFIHPPRIVPGAR